MTPVPLPTAKRVHDLFADLLGREVTLTAGDVSDPPLAPGSAVALYRDDRQNPVAAATPDRALATYLPAALALSPKDLAVEVAAGGEFPADFAETLQEIFNIMGTLFNSSGSRPVRFHTMSAPGHAVPPAAAALACRGGNRIDLDLAVAGYGTGRLALGG